MRYGPRKCPLCKGGECRGGGNKSCLQRDPLPSILAGILDTYGCIRFVVTHRDQLQYHVRPDELCIVVPNLTVHEPIAWGESYYVVGRIEHVVDEWIRQRGIPNDPHMRECVTMYRLRQLENPLFKKSLDISRIVET
jgi:hypothetical protein